MPDTGNDAGMPDTGNDAGMPDTGNDAGTLPDSSEDWTRDILSADLSFEVRALKARASIELAPSTTSTGVSFEAAGLTVASVRDTNGALNWRVTDGRLDVEMPLGGTTVIVEYGFAKQGNFKGLMSNGSTMTWPYYCGNLFPCESNPAEGLTFTMNVTDLPAGEVAVYPGSIPSNAPAYQMAWASGDYTELTLGTTRAGTTVKAWYLPGGRSQTQAGMANLVDIFDWYETTYGAYAFGDTTGAVSVNSGFGGMEHHPYWHVDAALMSDELIQAHEAAHGWFGGGVRIACWEDFVLSEGTVSYIAARAVEEVVGKSRGSAVWAAYESESLGGAMRDIDPQIAWPNSCGEVDILADGLFSDIPYTKGALFLRAVAQRIGFAELDAALATFYANWVGQAASMQDLLDQIQLTSGYDPTACAQSWLRERNWGPDTCP
jgi:aminopeptidase N